MEYRPVVEITRGGVVESVHNGVIAVTDSSGALYAWWGDVRTPTYLRSSAKPFQALPLIESGAAQHFGLSDRQIAVVCASHSGTDEHVQVVASIQDKAELTEEALGCGTHPPFHRQTARRLEQEGLQPTPLRHNCSGKHTGMLVLARFLGESMIDYLETDHPVQQMILGTFAEMCLFSLGEVVIGIDGCSAPNFAVPLQAAATAYARLVDSSGLESKRKAACQRVVAAMTSHPDMVGGPERFDTRLMEVTGGRLVSKGGAEGYQGIGILPKVLDPNSPALGVAIKIADGDRGQRARAVVTLSVLDALGALKSEEKKALADYGPKALTNHRDLTVGLIRPSFQLAWRS
jgi:L-asparaginase II